MAHAVTTRASGPTRAKGSALSAKGHHAGNGNGRAATREQTRPGPLSARELEAMHAYWRACNYLSVGMIYLKDNPLLRRPLQIDDIKYRLLGHWGASPTLSFVWTHLNRLIVKDDLDVIFVAGPGHGAPGVLGPTYLDGSYSEIYPDKSQDEDGMRKFFKQFSFPGHIGSHVTPETPGSIHEGGELGYSLSHAYGMALDNPDLIAACVVGDGEAETGPLATSWHSNKFINPVRDGAVLPILNLNGYKIANPTILARISHEELEALFVGYGYKPYFVEGGDPMVMHQEMAATLERAVDEIRGPAAGGPADAGEERHASALADDRAARAEGLDRTEGARRTQAGRLLAIAPGSVRRRADQPRRTCRCSRSGCRATSPMSCSTKPGGWRRRSPPLAPRGDRRMGSNPHANGGVLRKELRLPDFRAYAVDVSVRGSALHENTRPLGEIPARRDEAEPDLVPRVRPRRNGLQSAAGGLRGEQEGLDGGPPAGGRGRRRAVARRPRHGDALRAHAARLAGGLPAHRPPRPSSTPTKPSRT